MAGTLADRNRLCSSNDYISNLIDDLLLDILLRLPVKFLHCCKSVCKRWHSLISSPCFARSFFHHLSSERTTLDNNMLFFKIEYSYSTIRPSGIGQVYVLPEVSSSLPLTFDFIPPLCSKNYCYDVTPSRVVEKVLGNVHFRATYGGLVLLEGVFRDHTYSVLYNRNLSYYRYYVCSPVTKYWLELPLLSTPGAVGFACYYLRGPGSRIWADFASCSNMVAQNPDFNPNLIDFTVISVKFNEYANLFTIRVFSSADERPDWALFRVPLPPGCSWISSKPDPTIKVGFFNGKFHWCGDDCIAVYDPFNNPWVCDVIPLPPTDSLDNKEDDHSFSLQAYQGHLRFVISDKSQRFLVWELVDYANKSWVKKFDVDFRANDDHSSLTNGVVVGDKIYMLNKSWTIMLFDVGNASLQHVYTFTNPVAEAGASHLQLFEPFLSSPWPTPVPIRHHKLVSSSNFVNESSTHSN